jgi:hypothetical protein
MQDFDELLDAAVAEREAKRGTATVEVLVGKSLVKLKFTELDTLEWANITSAHPQRLDAPLDLQYGYNVHTASEAAAEKSGVRIDGDEETELTPEQWKKLFKAIETPARGAITDAIWSLNEFAPSQRLARAKKASAAALKRKQSSPEK